MARHVDQLAEVLDDLGAADVEASYDYYDEHSGGRMAEKQERLYRKVLWSK